MSETRRILIVIFLLFVNISITRAATIYVDDDSSSDPCHYVPDPVVGGPNSNPIEDGSAVNPYDSIQKAIDNAQDFDEIVVSDGNYAGPGNYNIDPCGLEIIIRSENGFENCIIDCNDLGNGFTIQNLEGPNTVIDGFTIKDGNSPYFGGAIDCNGTSPIIQNCKLINNQTLWYGGGIFLGPGSSSKVINCQILGNTCHDGPGGGIYSYDSTPEIRNCLIAWNLGYWNGGVSSSNYSYALIENCTIADNIAESENGVAGLECFDNSFTIVTNSIIWGNRDKQIMLDEKATVDITYSDIQMVDVNGVWDPNLAAWEGDGNINEKPLFASPFHYDYHLKSEYGRWVPYGYTNGDFNDDGIVNYLDYAEMVEYWQKDGFGWQLRDEESVIDWPHIQALAYFWLQEGINTVGKEFEIDGVTSPCIDAGDPMSDFSLEPMPNGSKINMGTYGNTTLASKSEPIEQP